MFANSAQNKFHNQFEDNIKTKKNVECVVLIKDGVSLFSKPKMWENQFDMQSWFPVRKEKKYVKGVEESIFDNRYEQLYSYLDSLNDENWNFIHGKKEG